MRKILQICKLPSFIINKLSPYKFQHLKQAIINNDIENIYSIMKTKPKIAKDQNILMFTITDGSQQAVIFLIQNFPKSLNFNQRNQIGDSPLMTAIFLKKKKVIKALIPYSDLDACDHFKNTAFIAAAANGDIETLQILLSASQSVATAKNQDGQTAIHRACYFGEIETINWLIENTNLKVGQTDKKGNNGLHYACFGGQIQTIEYLSLKIKDPSRLFIKNFQKKTPMDILKDISNKIQINLNFTPSMLKRFKIEAIIQQEKSMNINNDQSQVLHTDKSPILNQSILFDLFA